MGGVNKSSSQTHPREKILQVKDRTWLGHLSSVEAVQLLHCIMGLQHYEPPALHTGPPV
jgi:hypothetical protein